MRYRSLNKTVEPTLEPVTLAEAKKHLRVEHDDDDTVVSECIKAAREWVESYLDATVMLTKWEMTTDHFPTEIRLPKPPMSKDSSYQTVTVTYMNDSGVVTTLPTDEYRVDRNAVPGVIRPPYSRSWPAYRADYNSITITWYAGYATTVDDVPRVIRSAILMLMTNYYENRNAMIVGQGIVGMKLEYGLVSLLDSIKWGSYT